MDIVIASLITALILLVEHYLPWKAMVGKDLPRPVAYILGVLAMLLPQSALYWIWATQPDLFTHPFDTAIMAMIAAWSTTIAGGLSVLAAYALDSWLVMANRADLAEREARILRPEVVDGSQS